MILSHIWVFEILTNMEYNRVSTSNNLTVETHNNNDSNETFGKNLVWVLRNINITDPPIAC